MNRHYDLIVAGGGFAGTCAAIAAGRLGQKVLLVEKWNCLGGAAAGCLVNPFMPFSTRIPETGEKLSLCNGIFGEIYRDLKENGYMDESKHFDEEYLKLLLNRMTLAAGVELLFDTVISSASVKDGRIRSVTCATKAGPLTLEADTFIDATGDAELTMLCGFPFRLGREKDSLCQPMTLCFRMSGVDKEVFRQVRSTISPLYREAQARGEIRNPREDVLIFDNLNDGVLHFNTTRVVRMNPTDPWDVTRAEIEAREQVYEMRDFLARSIPGFENCRVLSTSLMIGARESRMIEGLYTLTQEDLKSCTKFEDGIAAGNYDIDIHNPEGAGTSHYYFKPGEWYTIPYRCLIPKDAKNLLVAGRCISSTHEAQASYRIMPIVACIGEAAGTAAALARQAGVEPRDADVNAVRDVLKKGGAIL